MAQWVHNFTGALVRDHEELFHTRQVSFLVSVLVSQNFAADVVATYTIYDKRLEGYLAICTS